MNTDVHPTPQYKLLIVDDEQKFCQTIEQFFTMKGYEVRAVRRGDEALAMAGVFHPDVVLLDLLMPGIDGVETLKALKRLEPPPRVLVLSGVDHEVVMQGTLKLGADFYICKPADMAQLERLVHGFCPPIKTRH